jgi:hypothetical protein
LTAKLPLVEVSPAAWGGSGGLLEGMSAQFTGGAEAGQRTSPERDARPHRA